MDRPKRVYRAPNNLNQQNLCGIEVVRSGSFLPEQRLWVDRDGTQTSSLSVAGDLPDGSVRLHQLNRGFSCRSSVSTLGIEPGKDCRDANEGLTAFLVPDFLSLVRGSGGCQEGS